MPKRALAAACALALAGPLLARGDEQTQRALTALAKDRSQKVRAQAALILGKKGAREAVGALCAALETDDGDAVRLAAADALGQIRDPAARASLESARRTDPSTDVREAATRALAAIDAAGFSTGKVLSIEEPTGGGGKGAHDLLAAALAMRLKEKGWAVAYPAKGKSAYRLKPSLLSYEREGGAAYATGIKASVIAVDSHGQVAALVEAGARLKAGSANTAEGERRLFEAVAKNLSEDLLSKLR